MNEQQYSDQFTVRDRISHFIDNQRLNIEQMRARDYVALPLFLGGMAEVLRNRDDPVQVAKGVGAIVLSVAVGSTGKH